jgi:ABC-2 type transport system permease protein
MSLALLFKDELDGFYRSKVMVVLWIGLPILGILFYFLQPDTEGIPLSSFIALIVATLGGTIASAMLVVTIINEKERKVYDLFVIRPIHRRDLLLAKFLAVFLCVVVAALFSIALGLAVDIIKSGQLPSQIYQSLWDSFLLIVSMVSVSCAASVLIGVAVPSVLIGVIGVIYGSNQLAALVVLPQLFGLGSNMLAIGLAALITAILLVAGIVLFERKQL